MSLYLVAADLFCLLIQPLIIGQFQIIYASAAFAAKMWMRLHVGVISLHWELHPHNCPLVCQQIQIAIYRSQTQVRIGGLQPLIYHFSSGVLICIH